MGQSVNGKDAFRIRYLQSEKNYCSWSFWRFQKLLGQGWPGWFGLPESPAPKQRPSPSNLASPRNILECLRMSGCFSGPLYRGFNREQIIDLSSIFTFPSAGAFPVLPMLAKYWMTFFVFSVLPAPDSPLEVKEEDYYQYRYSSTYGHDFCCLSETFVTSALPHFTTFLA